MIRAALYARVSTDQQAREGDSIPAQRSAIRKYIDDHDNMVLAGEYIDDGASGTLNTREALQELLSDVRAGKVDIILVTKLDRLYRSIRHYLNMMETLDQYNVGWLAIWEPIYDTTTPQGRLIVNQMMSIAQFEAENTSQRIKQVFDYKVRKGEAISGKAPLGYSIVNKCLVPNEDAEIIRALFHHYDAYNNLHELKRYAMDELGLPYRLQSIKDILVNRRYIGEHPRNMNYCEPIVSRELFDRVQKKLKMNIRRGRKNEYIFSGMLRCSECGGSFCGTVATNKRKDGSIQSAVHYRCTNYFSLVCRTSHTIRECIIEDYLLENVRALLHDRELEYKYKEKQAAKNANVAEKYERKLARLKELYINELISLDEYKRDADELRHALDTVLVRKEEMRHVPIELPKDFDSLYATMTVAEKRRLWQGVIDKIIIYPDRSIEVIFL